MPFAKRISVGQSWRVASLAWNCLVSDTGWFLKKCLNRHFRGISFKMARISTNCCYHWTGNYCDKQLNHCPGYFFFHLASLLLQSQVKYTGDSCNGGSTAWHKCWSLRNVRWMGTEKARFLAFLCKLRHFTLHTLTGRSSKILIVYTVLEKYQLVLVQHGKSTYIRMRVPAHAQMKTGFESAER